MAKPQDIRRPVGDVQPNNFVNPGVVDNSGAAMVGALGVAAKSGMEIDSQMQQKQFGEAIDTLRSQYLTGISAQEAGTAGTPDAVDDGGPEDTFVPTAQDNRALATFGATLDQHQQAVVQGRRSEDMFRIAAERLYRAAVAKRPGLAREFRDIAQNYLGFDVVGASVDVAARQDAAWDKAMAEKSKGKAEQEAALIKRQREVWEKVYPSSAFVPDEQWAAYTASKMDQFVNTTQHATAAQVATDEMKMLELQGKKSSEADERFYIAQYGGLRASFDSAIDAAIAQASVPNPETGQRLIDSPAGMRQVITGLRAQLLAETNKIEQSVAGREVSADTKAYYRGQVEKTDAKLVATLSLKDDQEFMDRSNTILKAEAERVLLNDEQLRIFAAADNLLSDIVMDRIMKNQGKEVALMVARVTTGAMPVNQQTKTAARAASHLIAGIWPNGQATKADPMATSNAAQSLASLLSKFYLQDDSNFRPQDFTEWQGTKGILPILTDRAKMIGPSLTAEEKGEIVAQGAAAAGNSALRLFALLAKKSPGLYAKLDPNSLWRADTPGLAKPKPGAVLSPTEQQVLAHFGQQFNRKVITDFMAAYGGGDAASSWKFIAGQVKPMLGVKKQASAAAAAEHSLQVAQEASQGASGGGGATGVQTPPVGTVIEGQKYVGGDPGLESSWEPVDGK